MEDCRRNVLLDEVRYLYVDVKGNSFISGIQHVSDSIPWPYLEDNGDDAWQEQQKTSHIKCTGWLYFKF